ncbi:MAG: hypothetical protein PVG22_02970 [Chromatiales bacterium]
MHRPEIQKPAGAWEVKRRIKIPALNHAADALAVEDALQSIAGIRKLVTTVDRHKLVVWYDITQVDFQGIVRALEEAGFPPLNNWWFRRRMSWYQFADSNGRDNAKTPPAACCNKPPK